MASTNYILGYIFLAVGIAILGFTFLQAYGIFTEVMNGTFPLLSSTQPQSAQLPTIQSNASIQTVVGSALSSALSGLHINAYASVFILIAMLAVFASIGYKFAKIGLSMIIGHEER